MRLIGQAVLRVAAADHERADLVADLPALHALAERGDLAGDLQAGDVRQRQGTYPPPKGATDIPGLRSPARSPRSGRT